MWNRAPRTDPFLSANKLTNLSPALYNPYPQPKKKPCHVPFNCSTHALALADNDVPAPCTYNITYRKHRIKGGASLRFTDPRVTFNCKPGPSPLSYDPDLLYEKKCEKKSSGKIHRGKPPRGNFVPSVSIPPKLFDGFDIVKGKGLLPRPPPIEFRRHIEPIFHHFPYELSKTTLKYKGNHWSKLRAQRKLILSGDPDTPGPGHYDLLDKPPTSFHKYLVQLRAFNKTVADIGRSKLKEDGPSPCTYEINYGSIYGQRSFKETGTLPTAERFKYEPIITMQQPLNLIPPPTTTSTQHTWPPFNSSSQARPVFKGTQTSPAQCCIYNDTILYNMVKKLIAIRVIAPFGSTSERPLVFISNDNPGPGTYDLMEKPQKVIYGARDKNSYVPPIRLTPFRGLIESEVSPWSYDVSLGMKALYGRRDCHKGPTWIKKNNFDRTKWAIKDSPDAFYDTKYAIAVHCGQPVFNDRPKPKQVEITPGPADYHIHPLYGDACIRAHMTQNATSDLQYVKYYYPKCFKRDSVRDF